jgi:hypothetical protein
MAKNRKNQAAEIRFGPVLKVVLLCSLICGSAIGYVWQKSQIDRLGRKISEDENQLKQFKNRNKLLTDQIAFMRSPVMLDQRVKQLNLGLGPAQPLQVVRLVDVPPAPPQDTPSQFAQRPAADGMP